MSDWMKMKIYGHTYKESANSSKAATGGVL